MGIVSFYLDGFKNIINILYFICIIYIWNKFIYARNHLNIWTQPQSFAETWNFKLPVYV